MGSISFRRFVVNDRQTETDRQRQTDGQTDTDEDRKSQAQGARRRGRDSGEGAPRGRGINLKGEGEAGWCGVQQILLEGLTHGQHSILEWSDGAQLGRVEPAGDPTWGKNPLSRQTASPRPPSRSSSAARSGSDPTGEQGPKSADFDCCTPYWMMYVA